MILLFLLSGLVWVSGVSGPGTGISSGRILSGSVQPGISLRWFNLKRKVPANDNQIDNQIDNRKPGLCTFYTVKKTGQAITYRVALPFSSARINPSSVMRPSSLPAAWREIPPA
jgi:hypothetical protein